MQIAEVPFDDNGEDPETVSRRTWDGTFQTHAADVFSMVRACQKSKSSQFHPFAYLIFRRCLRNVASRINMGYRRWDRHPIDILKDCKPEPDECPATSFLLRP
ncbi:hypothetical protein BV25DRAFT_1830519 [Artomyces pyxidatus]|uniref:Uncharacterized protein n=1 Tax=Artomyces pyxidatus TaxID=48021 RepID=A0ACB8SN15_9AGAM|nr:hypothetical protein BV25DRAFT_1830519 [Artomyces pyxidatus]